MPSPTWRNRPSTGYAQEDLANDPFLVWFRADGLFPGARVHYRMLMRDGTLREFSTDLAPDFQGTVTIGEGSHRLADLSEDDPHHNDGPPPRFQGITAVEWSGPPRPCAEAGAVPCAPTDGSLRRSY